MIPGDALIATIRSAIAEQRTATLALNPQQLSRANANLERALNQASKAHQQAIDSNLQTNPLTLGQGHAIAKELMANAELVSMGQASMQRAIAAMTPKALEAPVYNAQGAAAVTVMSRPIASA